MDFVKVIELLIPVATVFIGLYIKDVITKATTKHKILTLEESFKEHRQEVSEINQTLNSTNQSLSALNATVKGLSQWLERVDERQHKINR